MKLLVRQSSLMFDFVNTYIAEDFSIRKNFYESLCYLAKDINLGISYHENVQDDDERNFLDFMRKFAEVSDFKDVTHDLLMCFKVENSSRVDFSKMFNNFLKSYLEFLYDVIDPNSIDFVICKQYTDNYILYINNERPKSILL